MLSYRDQLGAQSPIVPTETVVAQQNLIEIDATGYHVLIAALVILSTVTGCFLVITIFKCFVQRYRSDPSQLMMPTNLEKGTRHSLAPPSADMDYRPSALAPRRTSWSTASSKSPRSSEEEDANEPDSSNGGGARSSKFYFERYRTSREVVLLPPPHASPQDRTGFDYSPIHFDKQEEKTVTLVVAPAVSLERSSSTIHISRMDHPDWTPAGDVPPPIPVQVACEREMAARATYEAEHSTLKRAHTHVRRCVLGPLAKLAAKRTRAMSSPVPSSPSLV